MRSMLLQQQRLLRDRSNNQYSIVLNTITRSSSVATYQLLHYSNKFNTTTRNQNNNKSYYSTTLIKNNPSSKEVVSEVIHFPKTTNDDEDNKISSSSSSDNDGKKTKPVLLNSKSHAIGYLSKILNARVYDAAIETPLNHAKNLSYVSFYYVHIYHNNKKKCCIYILSDFNSFCINSNCKMKYY